MTEKAMEVEITRPFCSVAVGGSGIAATAGGTGLVAWARLPRAGSFSFLGTVLAVLGGVGR